MSKSEIYYIFIKRKKKASSENDTSDEEYIGSEYKMFLIFISKVFFPSAF